MIKMLLSGGANLDKQKVSKVALATFITGILIYPLSIIPLPFDPIILVNVLRLIPFITAISFIVISIINVRKNKRSVIFWIGASLHMIYIVLVPTLVTLFFTAMSNFD